MSGLDIEAIRARWEKYGIDNRGSGPVAAFGWNGAAHASAGDVPALLEQLERDRAALGEAVASVREQAAEIERLTLACNAQVEAGRIQTTVIERLRTEVKVLTASEDHRVVALEVQVRRLTEDRDTARAALADALQVLADLRGGTP